MENSLPCLLLPMGMCAALMACAPSAGQTASPPVATVEQPSGMRKARTCRVTEEGASREFERPRDMLVSNDGGWCSHSRQVGLVARRGGQNGRVYEIVQAPRHGSLSQENTGTFIVISYKPHQGYTGTDSFLLRSAINFQLPYSVTVMP